MNIILIKQSKGSTKNYQLTGKFFFLLLCVFIITGFSISGYIGYHYAQQEKPDKYVTKWQKEIKEQKKIVSSLKNYSDMKVNALTSRIGEMQGQINRLNALGRRLIVMADISSDEFDFNTKVAIGGPSSIDGTKVQVTELKDIIEDIEKQLTSRVIQLSVLEELILNKNLELEILPSGYPIEKGWLSSHYGMRSDPFTGERVMHKGVDFAGKKGSDVLTVASGVVTKAGKHYGYGKLVEINHGNGYVTRYGHNDKLLVKEGDAVQKGSVIALMGSSGRSTGPHVHFEVLKKGRQINPQKFLSTSR